LVLPLLIFGDFVAVLSTERTPNGAMSGSSCLGRGRSGARVFRAWPYFRQDHAP
jgi:hypothetical protein